jgi:teichuronic acid biosynthesis glycosyltransferase TuaC
VTWASSILAALDRSKLVTWERRDPQAKVLMVTNAWPHPERPTHGTFVRSTVEGMRDQGMRCDVMFIRGFRGPHSYLLAGLAMVLLPGVERGKYRLVHAHGGETALIAGLFRGAPVLASYLGTDILGPLQGTRREKLKCYFRSRLLRAHSVLMAGTTTKSREMQETLPPRARRRNWVIPDGIDRTHFSPGDREEARRLLGWKSDETVVISVGRRAPVKRLWLAERAIERASQRIPMLRWLALSDIKPDEMPTYYRAADCLLHPSASEGSPNVVKESMACGLPVVATRCGDVAELLSDVAPSAVCQATPTALASGLIACLSPRRRSNGREHTQHLGLDEVAARTLECYASLGVDLATVITPGGASGRLASTSSINSHFGESM